MFVDMHLMKMTLLKTSVLALVVCKINFNLRCFMDRIDGDVCVCVCVCVCEVCFEGG